MTNFEKYKDDLMEIKGFFAVDKAQRKVVKCDSGIYCKDCLFNNPESHCEGDRIKWLYKEYEPPVLSNDELELIKILGKINGREYKYIARDGYGVIRLFEIRPRTNKTGNYCGEYTYIDSASWSKILFSNITHKDGIYDIENKIFI